MFLLEPGPAPPRGCDSGFVTSRGGLSVLYLWYLVEVSALQT